LTPSLATPRRLYRVFNGGGKSAVNVKPTRVSLIMVVAVMVGGCGSTGDKTPPTTSTAPVSSSMRKLPSYKAAKIACGAVPRETLARALGLSATDAVAVARKYAERHAPLARRQEVYEGCYAALNK
jgi:hypothetical protein